MAAVLASAGFVPTSPASAAAPQVKTQAAGFHRTMLGDFEVTALSRWRGDFRSHVLAR